MTFRYLTTSRDGAVERLVLNRPDIRNAFNEDVIAELTAWAVDRAKDDTLRAVVLSGAGKVFCAGADLTWMSKMVRYSPEENLRDAMAMSRMFQALNELPVPLIGRIHGAALGGGCGLAATCDIVVADDQAVFGFTEVKLGILPATIAPFALAKIGRSAARELFLTGMRFGAARAREVGLVHSVVPLAELETAVDGYLREILTSGPQGIAAAKALIPAIWRAASVAESMELTSRAIATRRVSPEGQEGIKAFLEKRKAEWSI